MRFSLRDCNFLCDLVAKLSRKYMVIIHRNTAYIYVVVTFLDIVSSFKKIPFQDNGICNDFVIKINVIFASEQDICMHCFLVLWKNVYMSFALFAIVYLLCFCRSKTTVVNRQSWKVN